MGSVPPQPDLALRRDRELGAGAPAQAVLAAGQRLDVHRPLQPRQARQLLADHCRLQLPLGRQIDVLEVAAAAARGIHTRGGNPAWGRRAHLDGIGAHEAAAGADFGHLGDHPLPRQGMPHEEHLPLVPGHAMPAMRDRADLDLDPVTDLQSDSHRHHSPRRTSPGAGPLSTGSWPAEDRNCQGTLATITPGMKRSRVFSRSALWLCKICSHQLPTTYSGT